MRIVSGGIYFCACVWCLVVHRGWFNLVSRDTPKRIDRIKAGETPALPGFGQTNAGSNPGAPASRRLRFAHRAASCALAAAWLLNAGAVLAGEGAGLSDSRPVEDLTSRLLQKEVELAELNTRLFRQMIPRGPWIGRRWFFYQFTNSSLTAVGAFISGTGRYSYLHRSRISRAPRDLFEHAAWFRVGANIESVGGAALEIALDRVADQRDKRHGVDLPTLRKHHTSVLVDLDRLLEQRKLALADARLSEPLLASYNQEGVVITDIRNLLDLEFRQFLIEAKAARASVAIQHSFALAANAVSGTGSYIGSIYALQQNRVTARWRTRLGGASGIGDVIGGSLNGLAPFAMHGAEWIVKHRAGQQFSSEDSGALFAKLSDDRLKWQQRDARSAEAVLARDGKSVEVVSGVLADQGRLLQAFNKSSKYRVAERLAVNTIAGGSKVSNGVGGLIGAFHDTSNPHERFEVFGGTNLAYGAGYSLQTVELLRNQIEMELHLAKQRRERRTSYQLLEDQMAALQSLH